MSNDNERLKSCLVRYLNPADYHPPRIRKKTDKIIARKFEFEDTKFSVKIRDIQKIEKNIVSGSGLGEQRKIPNLPFKKYF